MMRLAGRAPRSIAPGLRCRLFHWREWQDESSGTVRFLSRKPATTLIRCMICKASFTVTILWATPR